MEDAKEDTIKVPAKTPRTVWKNRRSEQQGAKAQTYGGTQNQFRGATQAVAATYIGSATHLPHSGMHSPVLARAKGVAGDHQPV